MRVLVAGSTGAIGRQLVPRLVSAGHEVHGMTRLEINKSVLSKMGAEPVIADALDADQVAGAVANARPDVIVHQLTSIGPISTRRMERSFEATNRLRTVGTDHLLTAGRAVGVQKFVSQGHVLSYARTGGPVKTEQDGYDTDPPKQMRANVAALRYMEEAVLGARWTEGIVLRYGWFYGPGTAIDEGGETVELVKKGRFPQVGDGGAVWSFIHVADAADATVAAIEGGTRGAYNIADDDPATVAEWLPVLARRIGARKPRRVPTFLGRLAAGDAGVTVMTQLRGMDNAKAERELGWRPARPSWRRGLLT